VLGYDCYEAMKALYRKGETRDAVTDGNVQPLVEVLSRLSSPQIMVLDVMLAHFQNLLAETKTEESDEAYQTKLSLSVGRRKRACVWNLWDCGTDPAPVVDFLRPQVETVQSTQDLTPSRLFQDLMLQRGRLLPSLVERACKTLDRPLPQRKGTRPVDQRISRSKLSVSGEDGRDILRTQVPRTPSRSSILSSHIVDRSIISESDATPTAKDEQPLVDELPSEAEGSHDLVRTTTGVPENALESTQPNIEEPVDVEYSPGQPVPAATHNDQLGGQSDRDKVSKATEEDNTGEDVVLSLPSDQGGLTSGGVRLSRKRPVSKDLDQPIQEGESALRRTGSSETSKSLVRGPRREHDPILRSPILRPDIHVCNHSGNSWTTSCTWQDCS
jgi:hypothetical protein